MANDPSKDPSTCSAAYMAMLPTWKKIETLLGGTEVMRAAGQLYLPQHENESQVNYQNRKLRSVLFNLTQMTLDSWVGRPFSDPLVVSEEVPDELKPLLDDVDMQGNNCQVFCRQWFKEGVAKSFSHVLVDFPVTAQDGTRTLDDDRKENLRPYWCFLRPENVISMSSETINGREYLTHVRIRESELIRDGFSEREVERIRVFDRVDAKVLVSLWELRVDEKKKKKWVMVQAPTAILIDVIPLITFYANRLELMKGKSPLEDLADLNISHWQSQSDQDNVLTVARFPILAQSGASPDGTDGGVVVIGPRKLLATSDPAGRFYYVEHSGAAIEAGRKDLLDKEERMGNYGADFLKKRPGNSTATAKALDSAEATSPLQDTVLRFNDALHQVMDVTAKWAKVEYKGTVNVNVDFGPEVSDASDLSALASARVGRDISRETYLAELRRRGVLSDDFDPEKNEEQLTEEKAEFAEGEPTDGMPIDDSQ